MPQTGADTAEDAMSDLQHIHDEIRINAIIAEVYRLLAVGEAIPIELSQEYKTLYQRKRQQEKEGCD